MKTTNNPRKTAVTVWCMAACLMALHVTAYAQDSALPGPSVALVPTEMQKWFADLDAQLQATFKRDVSDVHTAELDKLKIEYLSSIQAGVTKASDAGDLNGAVALRAEKKRFSETNDVPPQDDAADPLPVKQLRAGWRAQITRIEKDRAARAKALHAKYDQVLAQAQTQLTQRQRLDDALLVKAKRDEVAAAWLTPVPATYVENLIPPATIPSPPTSKIAKVVAPINKVPFGTKPGPTLAKVEVQDTLIAPLSVGESVLSDTGKVRWTNIPESFQGYQFTKGKGSVPSLRYKVLTDGLVQMACTSRFGGGGNSGGGWKDEVISEQKLQQKGWHRERKLELKTSEQDHVWWIYSRTCTAGEEFNYRTEKYRSPILLVK